MRALLLFLILTVGAAAHPGLEGRWQGDDWGEVVLLPDSDETRYTGTYTDTFNGQKGMLEVRAGSPGTYSGSFWETSATAGHPSRTGRLTLTITNDESQADVRWESTDKDESRAREGTSHWQRQESLERKP